MTIRRIVHSPGFSANITSTTMFQQAGKPAKE